MRCDHCSKWATEYTTVYDDGTRIVRKAFPEGRGNCEILSMETGSDFGCVAFAPGDEHAFIERKSGAPWQHFVMIPCPGCRQKGEVSSIRCTCAGTGLVRLYDDGFIGDEHTRIHPKEIEFGKFAPPKCASCGGVVGAGWVACPKCGNRLMSAAETEIINNPLGMASS